MNEYNWLEYWFYTQASEKGSGCKKYKYLGYQFIERRKLFNPFYLFVVLNWNRELQLMSNLDFKL